VCPEASRSQVDYSNSTAEYKDIITNHVDNTLSLEQINVTGRYLTASLLLPTIAPATPYYCPCYSLLLPLLLLTIAPVTPCYCPCYSLLLPLLLFTIAPVTPYYCPCYSLLLPLLLPTIAPATPYYCPCYSLLLPLLLPTICPLNIQHPVNGCLCNKNISNKLVTDKL